MTEIKVIDIGKKWNCSQMKCWYTAHNRWLNHKTILSKMDKKAILEAELDFLS